MDRKAWLQEVAQSTFDVIVIGGGITGAGIALDAASRGLRVLLLEKSDFAAGTSSRSTKLIHGGLRYLKQLQIGLVWRTGRERALLHKLAPHLVYPGRMLLPILKGGSLSKWTAGLAVSMYDWLAGVVREDRKQYLNAHATCQKEPLLNSTAILGGILYTEYQTDDARLTMSVICRAADLGAVCLNYAAVTGFSHDIQGKVTGVFFVDATNSGATPQMATAPFIVNAAGPWVDEVARLDTPAHSSRLQLSRGVHIVLPFQRLPIQQAIYFDAPDKRMIFAIPKGEATYVGTTDSLYQGSPDQVAASRDEMLYLLDACNQLFVQAPLTPADVVSSWVGLRPLVFQRRNKTSEISRKEEVFHAPSGLLSIAGGKLTGYRLMAKTIVDTVCKGLSKNAKCRTHSIDLHGAILGMPFNSWRAGFLQRAEIVGLSPMRSSYLSRNYGAQADQVLARFESRTERDMELRLLLSELDYSVQAEHVFFPDDFLIRRTGRLYFELPLVEQLLEPVLAAFEAHFGWNNEILSFQTGRMRQLIEAARLTNV